MKISANWLREISGIDADVSRLVAELTMVGIKLEGQEAFGDDVILDFEITVNRPDWLSVYGIAREACLVFRKPMPALPEIHPCPVVEARGEGSYEAAGKPLHIVLEEPELCSRYCGQLFTGVKVGPSPEWLRQRLEGSGVRSINNVVDVTNYVMLELGQPLHAFDYDRLKRGTIRVRRGRNEPLVLIDGKERLMRESMLVIADDEIPVGVGGVMGGKDSEVSDSTTTVLLECAYFQPATVRKTRRDMDLSTDASYRFERGVDPQLQAYAERRAALLLQQVAGGPQVHPVLDVSTRTFEPVRVSLRNERIERVLGSRMERAEVDRILTGLGFVQEAQDSWLVPSFRVDVRREIDLIEEVARHYGYNNFPDTLPSGEKRYQPDYPTYELELAFSKYMQIAGVDEANTYSFVNPASPYAGDYAGRPRLLNPISETATELRASLIPGLLEAVEFNIRHRNHDVRLYEIGRVFLPEGETVNLGIVYWGDYLGMKGILESGLPALNYSRPNFRDGSVLVDGRKIGSVGQAVVEGHTVQFCEIVLNELLQIPQQKRVYVPIIPFPYVERDASLMLDETIPYSALEETVRALQIPELRTYKLVDRYKGKNMPAGKVSLSLRFLFQSDTRTLFSEEVDILYNRIIAEFSRAHSAELRK